ncbi:MAG: gliding motility-associated C-terminal domain-containing protein [Porphyromonadaceae bacterium]|nr:gliding motility-associated C-terminal domain-containing protein [Porphyromonadaceae bacterium]
MTKDYPTISTIISSILSLVLLVVLSPLHAAPLGVRYVLAKELKAERLKVYLTHGKPSALCLEGKASGRVRRYQRDALRSEAVAATFDTQEGCWRIDNPVTGYGYFVEQPNELSRYTYIIDYTAHRPNFDKLSVEVEATDPCARIRLGLDSHLVPMVYYTPSAAPMILPYRAELSYENLRWDKDTKTFVPYTRTQVVEYSTSPIAAEASLADTPYTFVRDLWASDLGLTSSPASSELLESKRIEVHAGVDLIDSGNEPDWQQLSAPCTLRLWARGNEPSTAKYHWVIELLAAEGSETILSHTGSEVEQTLSRSGIYRIRLEALGRDASCIDNGFEQELRITESALEVPNAFTPGSTPGINDVFRVLHRSLTSFSGKVFTASGQEIYRWVDPNGGWDGTHRGALVPTGAYYYAIDAVGADGIRYEKRGVVHVIRSEFDTF